MMVMSIRESKKETVKLVKKLFKSHFATPWTVACQAPLSVPILWDFPGKNTGVGSHSLLHRIFLTQGLNVGLLLCSQILYLLNHQGNPEKKVTSSQMSSTILLFTL